MFDFSAAQRGEIFRSSQGELWEFTGAYGSDGEPSHYSWLVHSRFGGSVWRTSVEAASAGLVRMVPETDAARGFPLPVVGHKGPNDTDARSLLTAAESPPNRGEIPMTDQLGRKELPMNERLIYTIAAALTGRKLTSGGRAFTDLEALEVGDIVAEAIHADLGVDGSTTFPEVSRVTVVSDRGVEFEHYDLYTRGVAIHLQDDGRTLKLFPAQPKRNPDDD